MAGKILIVDDVATNRIVLKVKLAAACYETLQAEDGATALRLAQEAVPDLIVLDVMLPDLDGLAVCRRLRADPATCNIPVIVVTALDDIATRLRAFEAGADDFLPKPIDDGLLLARLRSLMRAREAEAELRLRDDTCRELGFAEPVAAYELPALVALIAPETATALHWRTGLVPLLDDRLEVMSRAGALAEAPGRPSPDAFVIAIDPAAPPADRLRLMSELRSRPATRHAAVCVVLPEALREMAAMALDLGASDLLIAPFDPRELALRLKTLLRRKRLGDRLRASVRDGLRLAATDPLTGLYNRRYALPHLSRIAERAVQTGRRFAVMVLDLDRFKTVNDSFGHGAGDAVLVAVAHRLADNLRAVDLLARIGGEEFLIALPDSGLETARITAERLCRLVEAQPIALPDGAGTITVTLSIGLAICEPRDCTAHDTAPDILRLIDRADKALLDAKAEGRNQVTVSRPAA